MSMNHDNYDIAQCICNYCNDFKTRRKYSLGTGELIMLFFIYYWC